MFDEGSMWREEIKGGKEGGLKGVDGDTKEREEVRIGVMSGGSVKGKGRQSCAESFQRETRH